MQKPGTRPYAEFCLLLKMQPLLTYYLMEMEFLLRKMKFCGWMVGTVTQQLPNAAELYN